MDAATARWRHDYGGRTHYFCCDTCMNMFAADPAKYLAAASESNPPRIQSATAYACPMDPEVHAAAAGPCPVCGMALQPVADFAPAEAEYVCPMHPEVRLSHPGTCPKCGMALEPRVAAATEERPDPELIDMTRRFWLSAALAIPVLFIEMSDMLPGMPVRSALGARPMIWLEFALTTPVVVWGGAPFFVRAARSLVNRALNMFTLIALGVGIAYG
ncbi:MAG TPA: heavy metal-binding domain-containing protein, partial [Candidatus Binataceae bacterium]|nr:heavy metal-binding domain-containing protein [Candidatus Binataceae bacterium]